MKKSIFIYKYIDKNFIKAAQIFSRALALLLALFLSACIIRDGEKERLASVDRFLITNSIKRPMLTRIDKDLTSDSEAMLDAVAVLAQQSFVKKAQGWANARTGSRGVLSLLGKAAKPVLIEAQQDSFSPVRQKEAGEAEQAEALKPVAAVAERAAVKNEGTALQKAEQDPEQKFVLCRLFRTTRESFDGIVLYKGEACKYGEEPWSINYLRAE